MIEVQREQERPRGQAKNKQPFWKREGERFVKQWVKISAQTVNSPEYKQLKEYIHKPYQKRDHNQTKCFYFPTYVIFKIKNITEFDFDSLSANINGVLLIHIRVDYQNVRTMEEQSQKEETKVYRALEKLFSLNLQEAVRKKEEMKLKNQKEEIKEWAQSSQLGQSAQLGQSGQRPSDKNKEGKQELKKFLYIQFNRDNPLRLPSKRVFEGQIKVEEPKYSKDEGIILKWTIRKEFTIALSPGTVWQDMIAPFNLLNFKLTLSFQDIDIQLPSINDLESDQSSKLKSSKEIHGEKEDPRNYRQMVKFKFNCMKRVGNNTSQEQRRIFEQLMFTDDGSLGQYDLAETGLNVECEKYLSRVYTTDQSSKYRSYKVITFTIPFYKYPIMDALTIFIPLVLITILTLFTFVQGPDFNDKIGNIATLMIVYVGLMPVINDSLPPTTQITLIDIVLYCQLLISVLCLIKGFQIKDYDATQFSEYRIWSDDYFIASVVIASMTGVILALLLIYYCVKKAYFYNLQEKDIDESDKKFTHWVSPHMYSQARSLKTQKEQIEEEVKREKSRKEKEMNLANRERFDP